MSETPLPQVAETLRSNVVLIVHHTVVTCNSLRRYNTREFLDYVLGFAKERDLRLIAEAVPDEGITVEECVEIARFAREKARLN